MEKQYMNSRKLKGIAVVAIIGLALAALGYKLNGDAGHGCSLFSGAGWFVLQILHPVLVVGWQSVQAYVSENSRFLQHLPDIVAFARPLLCVFAGRAW
jgi:hypothetical protein